MRVLYMYSLSVKKSVNRNQLAFQKMYLTLKILKYFIFKQSFPPFLNILETWFLE